MFVRNKELFSRPLCGRQSSSTVFSAALLGLVALLNCGCGNSNRTIVTMKYIRGTETVLELPVKTESSRHFDGDWSDGESESLEVVWKRHPDITFDEVWIGYNTSDLDERELLGYVMSNQYGAENRVEISYPSTHQLFMTVNLRDVPSSKRSRIRCITLVNRIDDSPVSENSLDFTLNMKAWQLATIPIDSVRNGPLAVRFATLACEKSNWKEPNYVDTLAAAYAENGEFAKAIATQKKAITLAAESDHVSLTQFRNHLAIFESGQCLRSPLSDF